MTIPSQEVVLYDQPFSTESRVVPTRALHDLPIDDWEYTAPELRDFIFRVKEEYPYLSFATGTDVNKADKSLLNMSRVYVYMPHQCYTLGAIGHGTVLDESQKDDTRTYNVWSPHIQNRRYKYGAQKYMKTSDTLSKAVSNVKFIRPLTPVNYLQRSAYDIHTKCTEEITRRERIVGDAKSKITGSPSTYFDDLIGAYQQWSRYKSDPRLTISPYEYKKDLADKIDTYLDTATESAELLKQVTSSMYQVRTTEYGFDVNLIEVPSVSNSGNRYALPNLTIHPVQTYKGGELPSSISGKLAILDMTHAETAQDSIEFILGVGYPQIKGHLYYVTA